MLQNLIVGFVLVVAIAYLTVSYVKRRRSKTGCAHCAVARASTRRDDSKVERSG